MDPNLKLPSCKLPWKPGTLVVPNDNKLLNLFGNKFYLVDFPTYFNKPDLTQGQLNAYIAKRNLTSYPIFIKHPPIMYINSYYPLEENTSKKEASLALCPGYKILHLFLASNKIIMAFDGVIVKKEHGISSLFEPFENYNNDI